MKLPADATIERAAALAATLPQAVAQAVAQADGTFAVDASAVTEYDSATLALLMQARRLSQAAGLQFTITGLPQQLCQLAVLYGVDELLSATPACGAAATAEAVAASAVT